MLKFLTPNREEATLSCVFGTLDGKQARVRVASSDYEQELTISRPYHERKHREYNVFFLRRKEIRDNNVFDLRDLQADERVGLLAPVGALSALNHSRAEDEYFQAVASNVFWTLLDDPMSFSCPVEIAQRDNFEISEFYPEDCCILAVNPANCKNFDINRFLPGLFSYGYTWFNPGALPSDSWKFNELPRGKEIKILPTSSRLAGEEYLRSLYREMLPFERNQLSAFLLQYQLFEMMMHSVFCARLDSLKQAISDFSGTASDLRELIDPIQQMSNERTRIRDSIAGSSISSDTLINISDCCSQLLKTAGRSPRHDAFPDLIYDVRNLIFHNFRGIPAASRELIRDLNTLLAMVMPKLLSQRKSKQRSLDDT